MTQTKKVKIEKVVQVLFFDLVSNGIKTNLFDSECSSLIPCHTQTHFPFSSLSLAIPSFSLSSQLSIEKSGDQVGSAVTVHVSVFLC